MSSLREEIKVPERKVNGKNVDTLISEMNAYRDYVKSHLQGFLAFMEGLNVALNLLEEERIMANIKFNARIKDAIGAVNATDKKTLDDIFGLEIITVNEEEKELLMLLINTIFDPKFCAREKKVNKANGYKAYHRVGTITEKSNCTSDDIKESILNSKTKPLTKGYKNKSTSRHLSIISRFKTLKTKLFRNRYTYPKIRKLLKNKNISDTTIVALLRARKRVFDNLDSINSESIPVFEMQFKTLEVWEEAIFGTASHCYYKPIDAEKLINDYNNGELIRGLHFPIRFSRKDNKMDLQTSNDTLFQMYPFLNETMKQYKKVHTNPIKSYNRFLAIIFPELKAYFSKLEKKGKEPSHTTRDSNPESVWRKLIYKAIDPQYNILDKNSKENERG